MLLGAGCMYVDGTGKGGTLLRYQLAPCYLYQVALGGDVTVNAALSLAKGPACQTNTDSWIELATNPVLANDAVGVSEACDVHCNVIQHSIVCCFVQRQLQIGVTRQWYLLCVTSAQISVGLFRLQVMKKQ